MSLIQYEPDSLSLQKTNYQAYDEEFISLCGGCIVYRNVFKTKIFKWIREVQSKYDRQCALLLVRQIDNNLQLLWAGTIPQPFWFNRRKPTKIIIDREEFLVLSSMSIGEEP